MHKRRIAFSPVVPCRQRHGIGLFAINSSSLQFWLFCVWCLLSRYLNCCELLCLQVVRYTTQRTPGQLSWSLVQLKAIREENVRRADVLSTWSQAVREQLPGMATAVPAESMARHQHGTGVASPQSGAGARTVSFHSYASGPSENPQVLRDVINSAAAAGTVLIALCQRYAATCCSFLMFSWIACSLKPGPPGNPPSSDTKAGAQTIRYQERTGAVF